MIPVDEPLQYDDDTAVAVTVGVALTVTEEEVFTVEVHPTPVNTTDTLYAPLVVVATVGVNDDDVEELPVAVVMPGPLHV